MVAKAPSSCLSLQRVLIVCSSSSELVLFDQAALVLGQRSESLVNALEEWQSRFVQRHTAVQHAGAQGVGRRLAFDGSRDKPLGEPPKWGGFPVGCQAIFNNDSSIWAVINNMAFVPFRTCRRCCLYGRYQKGAPGLFLKKAPS